MFTRLLSVTSAVLTTLSICNAQATILVDDDGGAGIQFTSIAAAVGSASPGDRIVVYGGTYDGFALSSGVSILAQGLPRIITTVTIANVPAGQTAILSGFRLQFAVGELLVNQCAGTVVVDDCSVRGRPPSSALTTVMDSPDVRFHRTDITPDVTTAFGTAYTALRVKNARLELSSCDIVGGKGGHTAGTVGAGGIGLLCEAGSRVHVALTKITGGRGGDGNTLNEVNGGSGGSGVSARDGSELIVAGDANTPITGGALGLIQNYSSGGNHSPGWGAIGQLVDCKLRHSGAPILRGNGGPGLIGFSSITAPTPADPTLEWLGAATPGGSVLLLVHGAPGQNARLQQGDQPRLVDDGLSVIERLDNRIRLHPLGLLDQQGEASYPATVGLTTPLGWTRFFQGYQIDPLTGGLDQRTNSVIVVVR